MVLLIKEEGRGSVILRWGLSIPSFVNSCLKAVISGGLLSEKYLIAILTSTLSPPFPFLLTTHLLLPIKQVNKKINPSTIQILWKRSFQLNYVSLFTSWTSI